MNDPLARDAFVEALDRCGPLGRQPQTPGVCGLQVENRCITVLAYLSDEHAKRRVNRGCRRYPSTEVARALDVRRIDGISYADQCSVRGRWCCYGSFSGDTVLFSGVCMQRSVHIY